MQITKHPPADVAVMTTMASSPSAWVTACTNSVTTAAQAAELVHRCFRAIAAQQSALAIKVMTLATNGPAGGTPMMRTVQATKLSGQSCDLVIGGLIEALETLRQATAEINRLVADESRSPATGGN